MKNINFYYFLICYILFPAISIAQTTGPSAYPKITEYTSLFVPVVSTSTKTTSWNFSNSFAIGCATGINILYSDRFGFSFDLTPVITSSNGGPSKVSNLIFDPGPIFRFNNGLALITRIAFETAGRFGESTVISKVFNPKKKTSLFAALGIPIRFGNNLPASIGASLFFGIALK